MKDDLALKDGAMAEAAEEAAACLRAMSNPSRLLLLCELVQGERNVGDLEAALGLGQAYVSQQLARLRGEGMVVARRDGRIVYYSLDDTRVRPIIAVLYEQFCKPRTGA
jgi:ArsR family transcriptional regulator, virulence genes transcriptional regulator